MRSPGWWSSSPTRNRPTSPARSMPSTEAFTCSASGGFRSSHLFAGVPNETSLECRMKPFVINRHGRQVFPSNFLADLDVSVLETLDQFNTVIGRDFETKAPTGTELMTRIESGA